MSNLDEFDLFGEDEIGKKHRKMNPKIMSINTIEGRRQRYMFLKPFQYSTIPVFNAIECQRILNGIQFNEPSRHSSFKTIDKCVLSHPDAEFINQGLERILRHLELETGFEDGDLELLDSFFVLYNKEQPGLEPHTDGCLLSFNIQINDPREFQGGGTKFTDLSTLILLKQGECLMHSSKILHQGENITSGNRIILVGFVETKRRGIFSKRHQFQNHLKWRGILHQQQ